MHNILIIIYNPANYYYNKLKNIHVDRKCYSRYYKKYRCVMPGDVFILFILDFNEILTYKLLHLNYYKLKYQHKQ